MRTYSRTLELLLHPVRLRVIHAMSGGRTYTTAELCERMPGVSKATMYRQVGALVDGGMLEVVAEQRVHSVLERRYRLREEPTEVDPLTVAEMEPDDHRRLFGVAMATLLAEFNGYLDREPCDPASDRVSYRQLTLWLDSDELTALVEELRKPIQKRLGNKPKAGRTPYLLSPILFPTEPY